MSEKIRDIEQRKQELQQEIEELQQELDHSIEEARSDLSTRLNPKNLIKDYPLTSVGIVVAAGFLLGKGTEEAGDAQSYEKKSSKRTGNSKSDSEGFGAHIWSEFKRSATKRAVRLLMQYIDSALAPPRDRD